MLFIKNVCGFYWKQSISCIDNRFQESEIDLNFEFETNKKLSPIDEWQNNGKHIDTVCKTNVEKKKKPATPEKKRETLTRSH